MIPPLLDTPCLWERLRSEMRPIFLYGTGNGGDKILSALAQYGVAPTGVFASDGFVRSRTFHDFPVQAYSDVLARYGEDIVVLLAFGTTLQEVRVFIEELDKRHTLYIPDVPLYGGALFDRACVTQNLLSIDAAAALFSEPFSQELYTDALWFRWTGEYRYLRRITNPTDDLRTLFANCSIATILDGGAYRGDSAALFCTAFPGVREIWAAESDEKTYGKLCAYAETETRAAIHPLHTALWNENGEIHLSASASRGSGIEGKNHRAKEKTVPCATIDSLREACGAFDLYKLDVEGAEWQAISGAACTLAQDRPSLAVSLYHRTEDLWELPLKIHEILPEHRLYLRRPDCIPLWDVTLYAVKPNRI